MFILLESYQQVSYPKFFMNEEALRGQGHRANNKPTEGELEVRRPHSRVESSSANLDYRSSVSS